MNETVAKFEVGLRSGGRNLNNLRHTNILLIIATLVELKDLVQGLVVAGRRHSIRINSLKTKVQTTIGDRIRAELDNDSLE